MRSSQRQGSSKNQRGAQRNGGIDLSKLTSEQRQSLYQIPCVVVAETQDDQGNSHQVKYLLGEVLRSSLGMNLP
jgi:hypothetical protein